MYVIDQSILDDATALDVSWDLAQKNINITLDQMTVLRETYLSDRANLRRLANRANAIEYGRFDTAQNIQEMQRTLAAMQQALADYTTSELINQRGWEQVYKVLGAQDYEGE